MNDTLASIFHILIIVAIIWLFRKFKRKSGTQNTRDLEKKSVFEIPTFSKTAEMLDEDIFWGVIEETFKHAEDQYEQQLFLISQIKKLTLKQIVGFRLRTDKLLYDTYSSEMWCAGYIMNGGCSDDSFEYFRCWVISRGKDAYYKAKQNPDSLISEVNENIDLYDFEDFWYVALDAFKQRTGKDLYDYIDNENFRTKEGQYPQFEFTWKEEDPESMRKICPKLYKKFND